IFLSCLTRFGLLAVLTALIPASLRAQTAGTDMTVSRNKFPPSPSLRVTRNLEYGNYGTRRMLLDLYRPASTSTTPLPVIVVVRGNGWFNGDKEAFAFVAGRLAEAGFAAASVEYRPS